MNWLFYYPNQVWQFIAENIFWFKLGSTAISAILIWGIIHAIIGSEYVSQELDKWYDYFNVKTLPKKRAIRAWRKIEKRLNIGSETNLKLAVIEADKVFDEILKLSGFYGETMDERLEQATDAQISNLEGLIEAHKVAKKIERDPEFTVEPEEVRDLIRTYKKLFSEFGLVND